jgi:amino acid adenylation domain-containing protein
MSTKINIELTDILNKVMMFNETGLALDKNTNINTLFEQQVKKTPNNIAAIFNGISITYQELYNKVLQLSCLLRKKGVGREKIVGIMVERSIDMIVAILSVLKAGGAYLPIDPEYPTDRIEYMLSDSNTQILLIQSNLSEKVAFSGEIIVIDNEAIYKESVTEIENINFWHDLCYIIYTSGSTGRPKGVMIEHLAVYNFIRAIPNIVDFNESKRILVLTTISFDIFVLETLLPITLGMTIIIADKNQYRDPKSINKLIDKHNIDMLQTTPSRLLLLLEDLNNDFSKLSSLSNILVGGEAFPEALLDKLKQLQNTKIYNMYGPTETTVWSSVREMTYRNEIDIGKPIANTQIFIVDEENNLLPIDTQGEICISGYGLARGYINKDEITSESFVPNPFIPGTIMYKTGDVGKWKPDGNIEFIGRKDSQVKLWGYRIELGEIENILGKYEGIKIAAVALKTDTNGNKYLVGYYVPNRDISVSDVRDFLSIHLPDYMIPSILIELDEMPFTPNGKINKKLLPDISTKRPKLKNDYKEAGNEIERNLIEIWKQVLHIDQIGVYDSFFELGGDSLKIVRMIFMIESRYPGIVSVADVFDHHNVSLLSSHIINKQKSKSQKLPLARYQLAERYMIKANLSNSDIITNVKLENEIYHRIQKILLNNNFDYTEFFIANYIFFISRMIDNEKVCIHYINEDNKLFPLQFNLKESSSFMSFMRLLSRELTVERQSYYTIKSLVMDNQMSGTSILIKKGLGVTLEYLDFYDIAISFDAAGESFILQIQSKRTINCLDTIINEFLGLIKIIIEKFE